MHLLAAQPGAITEGEEAVDLGQTPGEMVSGEPPPPPERVVAVAETDALRSISARATALSLE